MIRYPIWRGRTIFLKRGNAADKLKRWELALLLAVAMAALLGARLGKEQDALAQQVIRLHVVANSDSRADQDLKLKVRDAVLEQGSIRLTGLDRDQALEALDKALPELGQVAADTVAAAGYDYPVRLTLGQDQFPTKRYDGFALPAGEYTALRVELGEGRGQNWWCVVYPPLCLGSASETSAQTLAHSGLSDEQVGLVTGQTQGYAVKFKAMELWENLKMSLPW